ncbi:MAG: PAS domain-containing protein [Deltaproteobacteria bacterium]|nr:PAS domain-containing protein [Deltaproteobacteria bacterium]
MKNLSLLYKVTLAFSLALIIIITAFLVTLHNYRTDLEREIIAGLDALMAGRAGILSMYIETVKGKVEDFSTDGFVTGRLSRGRVAADPALSEYLKMVKLPLHKDIYRLEAIDLNGMVIASTNESTAGRDVSQEPFFINGKEGVRVTERTDGYLGGPEVAVSAPIYSNGRVVGVLSGFVPLTQFANIFLGEQAFWLSSIEPGTLSGRKTFEIIIINRDRFLLTESRFIKGAVLKVRASTDPVRACIEKKLKTIGVWDDYRGVEVLGASACFPDLGWTLVAKLDRKEAYTPVRESIKYAAATVGVMVLVMASLIAFFGKTMIAKIRRLEKGACEMTAGKYDVNIPVTARDELGTLTKCFNDMAKRVKDRTDALIKSEAGLLNAQRIAKIGSWDWDIAKNTLHWSDEIYRIFGADPQSFGATYEAFLGIVPPEDRDAVQRAVDEALKGLASYSIDHRITLPDGTGKIVHEEAEVTFRNGSPVRMSGTVQDITERVRLEEERRKTEELTTELGELEAFSYTVAHDLRTPLRLIDGFSQVLMKKAKGLDETSADYLRRIQDAATRMSMLIEDILELAHVTRAEIIVEDVDLSSMAREVAGELQKGAPERKAEFVIEENIGVSGDPVLVRAVLENLLGNAWKFTAKEDKAIIELATMGEEEGRVIICVRDNGAGFDMEYAAKLFIPFQRLHSADEYPGTGVGLATVNRIITRHGGRVWAEGRPGEGAAFYFTLKRAG